MKSEPIRDRKKLELFQQLLVNDGKFRELMAFQFMFHTNLRVSDVLLLRWRDVMDDDGQPLPRLILQEKKIAKSKRKKRIPMTDELAKILLNYYHKYNPGMSTFIFRSNSNKQRGRNQAWTRQYVYMCFHEYGKKAGIVENIGAHTPRKTWGYHAYYTYGIDILIIQRAFNHTNMRDTLIYIGVIDEQVEEAHRSVSHIMKKSSDMLNIDKLPNLQRKIGWKQRKKK